MSEFIISPNKGVLVVFEGISGSGKSETKKRLSCYLAARGVKSVDSEWNSNPSIRKLTAQLHAWGILSPVLYSLLQWISFFLDYVRVISPALKQNQVVLADRYMYTAITRDAANGAGRFLGRVLCRFVRGPDWVFFCDTPPMICYERIQNRGKALFHPNKGIHQNKFLNNKDLYYLTKLREEYHKVFADSRFNSSTNMVISSDGRADMNRLVEAYIYRKLGDNLKEGEWKNGMEEFS